LTTLTPPALAPPITPAEITAAAKALGATGGGTGTAQLLSLLYDEQVEVDQVLKRLNAEPTLAARVLKVANSPFYRRAGTVGTVDRAVQVLGLAAIRGIAAAGCMDRLPMPALARALDAEQFARHSLAVATAAQALSKRAGAGVDGEAFMAGLLHDIGIVLLARLRPQEVALASQIAMPDAAAGLQAELDMIGADHTQCAAQLAKTWGLPGWLVDTLRGHHMPACSGHLSGIDALPALLALADRAAHDAGIGLWPLCAAGFDPAWAACLGLPPEACAEVAAELPALLQQLTAGS
jgi:putative nucleotidyltransferase with HDIG domain